MKKVLERASRDGQSLVEVNVGGQLHESALGAIYFAERIVPGSFTEPGSKGHGRKKDTAILKTLDLEHQNLWAVTLHSKPTLRDVESSQILYLHQDYDEAKDWMENWCCTPERKSARLSKVGWLTEGLKEKRDLATSLVRTNEYLCEAMVGLIVTKYARVPNFVKTYDAWISQATGMILQEHGGSNLLKIMPELQLDEFKSVIVQVLAALAHAQTRIALKHHDMHLENVFVKKLRPEDYKDSASDYKDSEACKIDINNFVYTLESCTVKTKNCGLLAKIADFGLSCVTDIDSGLRYERADYPLLDSTEAEWGSWNSTLEGQHMYDAVVFLSRFFMDEEKTITSVKNIEWVKGLYIAMQNKWPVIECSNIGRPLRGREGSAKIEEIFSLPYMSEFQ